MLFPLVTLGLVAVAPGIAAAAEGYTLSASTVYRIAPTPDDVRLDVESTYVMRNVKPDRQVDGGVRYFFFTGLTVPIEAGASELSVEVDGREGNVSVSRQDGFDVVEVDFFDNLDYQESTTVVVRYRLVGDRPRSPDSWVRVNPAYVSFAANVFADPGKADLIIEAPLDWIVEYTGDDLERSTFGDVAVYAADGIDTPLDFWVLFTARNDDRLASAPLAVGESDFELRGWPGDTVWQEFASRVVVDGVPRLEHLVGAGWPESGRNETDVIETSTPYLRGYAGYYYADTDVIEIGEDLDVHTMLHELSHAWFNTDSIATRWISEGLADEIGARATQALGERLPLPNDYEPPTDESGAPIEVVPFALNQWSRPSDGRDDASEYYGYRTAFLVMRTLRQEIGEARMTDLLTSVIQDERAYPGRESDAERGGTGDGAVDWKEFLDLAEQTTGSSRLIDLYRSYVVTPSQADELDDRAEALDRYAALEQRSAPWVPPEAVRRALADWTFVVAGTEFAAAEAALDRRDLLVDELLPLGLAPTERIATRYATAVDIESATAAIDAELAAARQIAEHRANLERRLAEIELDLPALEQSDFERSPDELASDQAQLADQAEQLVTSEARLADTAELLALAVPPLAAGSFVESPSAVLALSAQRRGAAEQVADAHRRLDGSRSLLERIGELGTSTDATIALADRALSEGEYDDAVASAAEVLASIDDFDEAGAQRLTVSAGIVAGAAMVTSIGLLVRRRRRSRRSATLDDDHVEVPTDADPAEKPEPEPESELPEPSAASEFPASPT